jgi:hypothetical protein
MTRDIEDLGATHPFLDLRYVARRLAARDHGEPRRVESQRDGRARRIVVDHLHPSVGHGASI